MNKKLKFQKTAQFSVLFFLGTMPVLFGAVHPIVLGVYSSIILTTSGCWLLLNSRQPHPGRFFSRWQFFLFFCIGWIVCSIIPLPINLLEILSPVRAASLHAVNQLADTDILWAPLTYNSTSGIMTAIFLFALLLYAATLKTLLAADRSLLKKIIYLCIGVGLFEAVYGMLQVANPHLGVLWLTDISVGKGSARGTIIYKNQYASLLNMCWPLAVGAALLQFKTVQSTPSYKKRKKRRKRSRSAAEKITGNRLRGLLFLFLAFFIMLAVLFSQSRGGVISMGLILSLLLTALPIKRKNKLRLTGCLLLLTWFYGSAVGFFSVIDRFMIIQESGQARFNIWLSSLNMLSDHLLTGIGFGSYTLLSTVYLKHFPEQVLYDRAHNDYLELTIELGLPMALLFFTVLFTALAIQGKHIWRSTRKKLPELQSATIISLVAFTAIAGFLFHGTADFGWRLPVNLLYITTLFVLLHHGSRLHHSHHVPHTRTAKKYIPQ